MMFVVAILLGLSTLATAEDPYLYFDWKVTYGEVAPLGHPTQGILINGEFVGPTINCTSNNNIVINLHNNLDEPLLLTWAGIQQRKNSWQDGLPSTTCPIQPGTNYTYRFQVKDQIGSFFYFPTIGLQRAAGGMGMLKVHSRELIPVPFDNPADEFVVLVGDWYNKGHKTLQRILDSGRSIGTPDGIQINGNSGIQTGEYKNFKPLATMEGGKTYRYRVCNVGLRTSINFRIQGHSMKLVELEGSHTVQNVYDSLDLHVGQCMSVLVTANQAPMDYYLVASSRFSKKVLTATALIHYKDSKCPPSAKLPLPPPENSKGIAWSMNQFRSFRWNLTASAARPNPQGSYHYGNINITRTIKIANSRYLVNGKLRFGINGVSHVDKETPVKLAEYFGIAKTEFEYDLVKDEPPKDDKVILAPSVVKATFRKFVEIIFENHERTIQTYNLDGYSFFAVGIEAGKWTPEKRKNYNLLDAVSRHTIQVYPNSWAAVMTTLDNAGMWNLRSDMRERAYLGQQLYFSVLSPERSLRDEYNILDDQPLCGNVKGLPRPKPYAGA